VERDVEHTERELAAFSDSDFGNSQELFESFNRVTEAIANTGEGCSFYGAQRFMAGRPREVLDSNFETLNSLNENLMNALNALLSSGADRESKVAKIRAVVKDIGQDLDSLKIVLADLLEPYTGFTPFVVQAVQQLISTRLASRTLNRADYEEDVRHFYLATNTIFR